MKLTRRDKAVTKSKLVDSLLKTLRWIKDRVSGLVQQLVVQKTHRRIKVSDETIIKAANITSKADLGITDEINKPR